MASAVKSNCEHQLFGWGPEVASSGHDITQFNDDQAACHIRQNEIDVLIDLMGWSSDARPGVLAYHPASLQVQWTSSPQPSGLRSIDAALVNRHAMQEKDAKGFSEALWHWDGHTGMPESPAEGQTWLRSLEQLLASHHAQLPPRTVQQPPAPGETSLLLAPKSRGRRYVIVAPPYEHTSAGIRVLYDLQKWLVCAGYDAMVCTWFAGYPVAGFADDIVIYPEVAPGNLLQAQRVVRYIMNTPGKLGFGEKTYAPDELLVAYNRQLAPYADGLVLQVPSTEAFFHDRSTGRDKDAVYVGKGSNLARHPEHCIEITKAFPPTRTALADFLRTVDTLYTYDNFSMIVYEAKLCGCKLAFINASGEVEPMHDVPVPNLEEFRIQLHQFIQITQAL